MTSSFELGRERQLLEWRPHFLSDAMRARRHEDLALEAVLHPAGGHPARSLDFSQDGGGISWEWQHWQRVETGLRGANGNQVALTRRRGESARINWRDLPLCHAIELTPYGEGDAAGVTVSVERPTLLQGELIEFDGNSRRVRVRLHNHAHPQGVFVQLLTPTLNEVLRDKSFRFNQSGFVDVPADWGYVAIVRRLGARRYLLDYRAVKEGGTCSEVADAAVKQSILRALNAWPPAEPLQAWLEQWPDRSRSGLGRLYEQALASLPSAAAAAQALRYTPTGLLRLLVLKRLGFTPWPSADQGIQQLNVGTFEEALATVDPRLAAALLKLDGPEEKAWALSQAAAGRAAPEVFEEVFEWAGGHGVSALETALALTELRKEVNALRQALRPESGPYRPVSELLAEIENAPFRNAEPHRLRERAEELRRLVRKGEGRPVGPEDPEPALRRQHQEWLDVRGRMLSWRRRLARLLRHCEVGGWNLPDAAPSPEDLAARLKRLAVPDVRPRAEPKASSGNEVKLSAGELLAALSNEPRGDLRELAARRLPHVVDNAALWGALHEEVGAALKLTRHYPWFAEAFGVVAVEQADLGRAARAAQNFLQTVEQAEEFARSWALRSEGFRQHAAADATATRKMLTAPDDPWRAAAYRLYAELRESLSAAEAVREVEWLADQSAAPLEVSADGRKTLNSWWEYLRKLDEELLKLETIRDRVLTEAEHLLPRLGRCLDAWRRQPPGSRPKFYTELRRMYERCYVPPGEVSPKDFMEAVDFLAKNCRGWDELCVNVTT